MTIPANLESLHKTIVTIVGESQNLATNSAKLGNELRKRYSALGQEFNHQNFGFETLSKLLFHLQTLDKIDVEKIPGDPNLRVSLSLAKSASLNTGSLDQVSTDSQNTPRIPDALWRTLVARHRILFFDKESNEFLIASEQSEVSLPTFEGHSNIVRVKQPSDSDDQSWARQFVAEVGELKFTGESIASLNDSDSVEFNYRFYRLLPDNLKRQWNGFRGKQTMELVQNWLTSHGIKLEQLVIASQKEILPFNFAIETKTENGESEPSPESEITNHQAYSLSNENAYGTSENTMSKLDVRSTNATSANQATDSRDSISKSIGDSKSPPPESSRMLRSAILAMLFSLDDTALAGVYEKLMQILPEFAQQKNNDDKT